MPETAEPSLPKLRTDLVVRQQETKDGPPVFVFKDPLRQRFYRFREMEHFIALQLNGLTSFDSIRKRVEERSGAQLTPAVLEKFVQTLRGLNLLESDASESPKGEARRRVQGGLLYLRLKAFNPDRLLSRMVGKLQFFFTPTFGVLSGLTIAAALMVTAVHWNDISRDLRTLWRFDAFLVAWVVVLAVTTLHEFGHGLTCKHFGGQVTEMGFMLIYFQPAFYCNVSDAWLFPRKSHRLWVTFAGAYFEVFIWAMATLTWRVVEGATWVSFLALVVMATSGIKEMFNLNPLIKLDGYYLLSDYLEIPNLRYKAVLYVRSALKRVFGYAVQGVREVTRRERRIYLLYGVLAMVYSYWLLGWIALRFGQYLIGEYQGFGVLLFAGLLSATFQNPVGRALRSTRAKLGSLGPKIKFLVPVLAVAVLFAGRLELKVAGEFNVLPGHNADVHAAVEGIIEEVAVHEGDTVRKGDLLVRLSTRDYEAALAKLDSEIDEKQANLRMLRAGARSEEIALATMEVETARTRDEHGRRQHQEAWRLHATRLAKAETAIKTAEERLQFARNELTRRESLLGTGLISRQQWEEGQEQARLREKELEIARAELQLVADDDLSETRKQSAIAQKEIAEAEGKLRVLRAGARPEAVEALQAEIARLETERQYSKQQLDRVRIVSPADGVVTTTRTEEKVGLYVEKGDLIVKVFELERVTPEVEIPENEIGDIQVGQPVVLKARAYPEKSFAGRVAAIAPTAQPDPLQRKVVRVTVQMDQADGLLKPEMTGNAKILCGKRPIYQLLTRRFARYVRVEFWSLW